MRRPKRLSIHLLLAPFLMLAAAVPAPGAESRVWPEPPADPVLRLESVLGRLSHFEVAVQGPVESKPRRIQKLKRPSGIAFDARGRLLVSDSRQRALLQVDPDLGVVLVYGTGTSPSLREPRGVAADADGTIFVADAGLRRVVAFDPRGEVTAVYGDGWLQEPTDVALAPDGSRLYVADAGARTVSVFDRASRQKVDTLGVRGGAAELYLPMAVEFDRGGNLLVVDQLDARVRVFDPAGAPARTVEGGREGFTRPRDVAADGSGRIFVTDSAESRIRVYGPDLGALLSLGRNGLGEGEFLEIGAIAVGRDQLAVSDQAGGRVQLFRLYGAEPSSAPATPAPALPVPTGPVDAPAPEPPIDAADAPEPGPLEATRLAQPPEAAAEPTGTSTRPSAPESLPAGEPAPIEVEPIGEDPPDPGGQAAGGDPRNPAGEATGDPAAEAEVAQRLLELVKAWAAAWSAQDVERYLGFYARSFRPANGSSRQAWSELRRARVSAPRSIEVEIEIVETRIEEDRAAVTFLQSYTSDRYADRVRKTLGLVPEDGEWRIERETVVEIE